MRRDPRFDASSLQGGVASDRYYTPIDEDDVDPDDIYHGRRVRWLGTPGLMMKIPAHMVDPAEGNSWYSNQLATYAEAIDNGDIIEPPAARIEIVTQTAIDESRAAYDDGESELLPFEDEDLGEPYAILVDGNHKAFAAILAGEPYIWVYVAEMSRGVAAPYLE